MVGRGFANIMVQVVQSIVMEKVIERTIVAAISANACERG
jgi:hypothetical protein